MNPTARFHRILERAQQIAKDTGLAAIDSYCVTRAMLDGAEYNMCYLAFLRMGINIDQFIETLDQINNERQNFTKVLGQHPEPTKPYS